MGCGCSKKKKITMAPASTLQSSGNFQSNQVQQTLDPSSQMVNIEYIGPVAETFGIRSRVDSAVMYRFGNNDYFRTRTVFLRDAEWLLGMIGADGPLYKLVSTNAYVEGQDAPTFLGAVIE